MPKRKNAATKGGANPKGNESEASSSVNTSSASNGSLETWTLLAEDGKAQLTPPDSPNEQATSKTTLSSSLSSLVFNKERAEEKEVKEEENVVTQDHLNPVLDEQEMAFTSANNSAQKKQAITIDDISDGISIISDSESAGRQTPLYDMEGADTSNEMKFGGKEQSLEYHHHYGDDYVEDVLDGNECNDEEEEEEEEQENFHTLRQRTDLEQTQRNSSIARISSTLMSPQVQGQLMKYAKSSLKGALYTTIVTIVIAVFIGKFRQLVGQLGDSGEESSSVGGLQQRIEDMELKNNLMRAEIDLLNKQVKYLTTTVGKPQQKYHHRNPQNPQKEETFKAWSGLGDNIQPVYIEKSDLKRPFQCDDGRYVEMAAMCLDKEELKQKTENFMDELSRTMNTVLNKEPKVENVDKSPSILDGREIPEMVMRDVNDEQFSWTQPPHQEEPRKRKQKKSRPSSNEFTENQERRQQKRHKKEQKKKRHHDDRRNSKEEYNSGKYYDSKERRANDKYERKDHYHDADWQQDNMKHHERHDDEQQDNWYLKRSKNREYQRDMMEI